MKRLKDYVDKDGDRWEVYARDAGLSRYYYMGNTKQSDYHGGIPETIKMAFSINKNSDYNGHKEKVVKEGFALYVEEHKYDDYV